MNGASAIDIQELLQEALVVQTAFATSSSTGGIGGAARTVNCSTTDQSASQGIGALIPVGSLDLTSFCAPPLTATGDAAAQDGAEAPISAVETAATLATTASVADGPRRGRRGRSRDEERAPAPRLAPTATWFGTRTTFDRARSGCSGYRTRRSSVTDFLPRPSASALRLAPGGLAGKESRRQGVATPRRREAHLRGSRRSPKGWQRSAGSGIAAILLALVLTPPLLRRVRDGAVVRRPVSVLAPIDVPI